MHDIKNNPFPQNYFQTFMFIVYERKLSENLLINSSNISYLVDSNIRLHTHIFRLYLL